MGNVLSQTCWAMIPLSIFRKALSIAFPPLNQSAAPVSPRLRQICTPRRHCGPFRYNALIGIAGFKIR